MCDTCTTAEAIEAYGVPTALLEKFAGQITDVVQEEIVKHLTETHDLMVATLMEQEGTNELRLHGPTVRATDGKLSTGRLTLKGEETEDRKEFVYTLTEDTSKPERPSEEDEFTALLRSLSEG